MRRVLFATFGSYGDLFPYLAIGKELQLRGHPVTIATSPSFESKVQQAGLRFHPVRPDVSLDNSELLAYIFDARRGSERVIRLVASVVRESFDDTLPAAQRNDVIVTHPITFGAVLVARKLRMPWASTILAPISFLSVYDPPVLAPAPWLTKYWPFGRPLLQALFAFGRRSALPWARPVTELCKELGLDCTANPVFEGSHSPSLVLALYSRLLGESQPDWPPNTVQTGFPFYNEAGSQSLDPQVAAFLENGPAPVVVTLGSSAVGAAGPMYRHTLEAVERLGVRALFLTGSHSHDLPEVMPPGTLEWPYAPHGLVFPRASAIIHQGGIGTTAQAMRAGRPMLIVPFAHDQFDNAERVRRLGAAHALARTDFTTARAEKHLERLLADASYADAASRVRSRLEEENGVVAAADAIEKL